jgi:hypothetical protein
LFFAVGLSVWLRFLRNVPESGDKGKVTRIEPRIFRRRYPNEKKRGEYRMEGEVKIAKKKAAKRKPLYFM